MLKIILGTLTALISLLIISIVIAHHKFDHKSNNYALNDGSIIINNKNSIFHPLSTNRQNNQFSSNNIIQYIFATNYRHSLNQYHQTFLLKSTPNPYLKEQCYSTYFITKYIYTPHLNTKNPRYIKYFSAGPDNSYNIRTYAPIKLNRVTLDKAYYSYP